MTGFHTLLGLTVMILAAGVAVVGLWPESSEGLFRGLAGWTVAALTLQLVSGFFILTSTTGAPSALHVALPVAGLAGLVAARSFEGGNRRRMIALAGVFVVAATLYAYIGGITHGD